MRAELDPPPGVTARIAGLPVLAAEANAALASPLAAARHAARRPARRRARAARRLPARASARWCRSCRSRSRPAGPRSCCSLLRRPAQPDVGDAGRARARDLDRVRRAARRAATARSARRASRRRGARAHVPLDRRGRARLRRDRDRRLRRAGVSDVRMLHDFGIVTVVDLAVSLLGVLASCRPCSCSPSARARARGRARRAAAARAGRSARRGTAGSPGSRPACSLSPTSRSTRSARAAGSRGPAGGRAAAAVRGAARLRRPRRAIANVGGRRVPASAAPAVCNVCDLRRERGRSCSAFVVPGVGRVRRARSTCSSSSRRASRRSSSPRSRARRPRRRRARAATGGSRSATTATARWRTSTASPSARVTFARAGGDVTGSALGSSTTAELARRVEALRRASPELVAAAVDAARSPPSSRRSRSSRARCRSRRGPTPPERPRAPRHAADRLRGARGASLLRTRPVPRPTACCSATRARPGRDAHAGRGGRARAADARRLASHGMLEDALTIAIARDGRGRSRRSTPRRCGARSGSRRGERLTLADASGPIAPLFAPPGPDHAPGRGTRALLLVAVVAPEAPRCSSRRRCGWRLPRSLQLTPRHDPPLARPSASSSCSPCSPRRPLRRTCST